MTYVLHPDSYICPDHKKVDLTLEVRREALAPAEDTVFNIDRPKHDYSPVGPFAVIVTCPGDPDVALKDRTPHELPFQGRVSE